ncbi:MAG TPA: transglycosylase domain-containing protein [Micromonosporaceae bacterium]|nr:transglycosylase domain-containing protein [Micromonosporaceae bacterium]
MRRRDHNILTNVASLLICGLLAGVVVAAAAFPAVALSGLAVKAGAETFDKLPAELIRAKPPQISYLYASDGRTPLATMYDENRRNVPLKDVAKTMQQAMIAAEDHKFYEHNGVDFAGVVRAFVANNQAGSTQQGASTLTMQYVRQSIAYSATHPQDVVEATEDTSARKLREMRLAMQLEKELSKDEILEGYLNIAPFGNGAYGVFAASQVYFGKHPRDLTIDEAAMLAGLVKAPSYYNPATKSGYPQAVIRRDYVIDNMLKIGAITPEQAAEAKAVKLVVKDKRTPNGCVAANKNHWGFFCDYFYRWWMEQEAFGATTYERERRLKSGGYKIVTTLDAKTQDAAKKSVEKYLRTSPKQKHALMLAAVEPGTGYVRALAVNRNFKLDDPNNGEHSDPKKRKKGLRGSYPNTTNPLLTGGGDIRGYQGGSTFKIFTLVAAMEKGYPLAYTINTQAQYRSKYVIGFNEPAACRGTHFYCPSNDGRKINGPHSMWSAFGLSVNTYFVPLQEQVGASNVIDAAQRLGIRFRDSEDARMATKQGGSDQWGAFTLGVSLTTPLDLANAYATLAADGKYCEPIPVQEIVDNDGKKLDIANPRCNQAVKPEVARAAVDAARCPVGDKSSTSRCSGATAGGVKNTVGKPVAGKTGTTDAGKAASLVTMTKQLAVAGIITDPDWANTTHSFGHYEVNNAVAETLRDAMRGKPTKHFTPPSGKIVMGDQRDIPNVKCQSEESAKSRLRNAGFQVEVDRSPIDSSCPTGTVAGTSPDRRTIKGGVVTIQISNGKGATTPSTGPGTPGDPGRPGRGGGG